MDEPVGEEGMGEALVPEAEVLTQRRGQALQHSKIAVAVGEGWSSYHAVEWALDNVAAGEKCVYLLHVQPPVHAIPLMDGEILVEEIDKDVVDFIMEEFRTTRRLKAEEIFRDYCGFREVVIEVSILEGNSVGEELVKEITEIGIPKIIIGTSSSASDLRSSSEGSSIASYVLAHAPSFCNVIVVKDGHVIHTKDARSSSSLQLTLSASTLTASDTVILSSEITAEVLVERVEMTTRTAQSSNANESESSLANEERDRIRNGSEPHTPISSWLIEQVEMINGIAQSSNDDEERESLLASEESDRIHNDAEPHTPNSSQYEVEWPGASETEESDAHDVERLKEQLIWVRREAEIQARRCKQAIKMAEEYDAQRNEEISQRDAALQDAHIAKQQTWTQARKCAELQASLEDAKSIVEATLMEEDTWRQKADDMAKKHQEIQTAHEAAMQEAETWRQTAGDEIKKHQETKSALDASVQDAEVAKQQREAADKRCEEALAEIEHMKISLELEINLRREAEEKVTREVVAKQEALAALRRAQRRYTEYTYAELQVATSNFDENNKLGEGGYGPVYKGKIHHTTVAIKRLAQNGLQGEKEFQHEVELLSQIHHPHMVMLLGACPESGCIVYEYMGNGSLEDRLRCKNHTPPLPWYVRFRICSEVATALLFLHSLPVPVVHRDLKPGNILLDHNFVSKISDVGIARFVPNNLACTGATQYNETVLAGTVAYIDPDYQRTGILTRESDVYALGIIMLQLLTGKPAVGVTEVVEEMLENGGFERVLDTSAGEWPLAETMQLAYLSLQCAELSRKRRPPLKTFVLETLESLRTVADVAAATAACAAGPSHLGGELIIPSLFICPISQEIMENPHIAADGFTYEAEAIQAWLTGHTTSPMTNLQLGHLNLVPNLSLKSAIREWQDKVHTP